MTKKHLFQWLLGLAVSFSAALVGSAADGDTVVLSFNVKEQAPKNNSVVRTDTFDVPTGENELQIILPGVYKGNEKPAEDLAAMVNLTLNGSPISFEFTFSELVSQNCNVIATATISVSEASTVAGEVKHPDHKAFVVSMNGEGGVTPGDDPVPPGPTPPAEPIVVEGDANIDLVTLTYHDAACTEYGLSFHSFTRLASPTVQIVEGVATSTNDFDSAETVSGSAVSETVKTTVEYKNYNPLDYSFSHSYEERSDVVDGETTYIYRAVLSGLGFGRPYSYRVGGTDAEGRTMWSPIYSLTTRSQTAGEFSFIFTADTQPSCFDCKGYVGMNRLLGNAFATAPNVDFLVSGGDFVYCSDEGANSITVWRNVINGGNNLNPNPGGSVFAEHPWFVTNGNHDNNRVQESFNNRTRDMSSDYYSYDYGDAHFVVLDNGHNGTFDTTQLTWLNNDLAGTAKKWKIVFVHFSFYCTTDRDLGVDQVTLEENAVRTQLLEYFDKYHVDLVVSAHVNESYYTTYPIRGGAKTGDVPTRTGGVDCYRSPSGTVYMQNAGSGLGSDLKGGLKGKLNTNTTDLTAGFRNRLPLLRDAEVGYEASFAVFDVSRDKLKVNRYYIDSSLNSRLYDNGQFQITK